jgi:hypothetical protein
MKYLVAIGAEFMSVSFKEKAIEDKIIISVYRFVLLCMIILPLLDHMPQFSHFEIYV